MREHPNLATAEKTREVFTLFQVATCRYYPIRQEAIAKLIELGVSLIPVKGKVPAVPQWKVRPSQAALHDWNEHADGWAYDGWAVVPGDNGWLVVDCDCDLFGQCVGYQTWKQEAALRGIPPTDFITKTPSGGFHLWHKQSTPPARRSKLPHVDIQGLNGTS